MAVSSGKGIDCAIITENTPLGDWRAFATWYTLKKILPEADICLFCRKEGLYRDCFIWSYACKVPRFLVRQVDFSNPCLFVYDTIMMVRPLEFNFSLPLVVSGSEYCSRVQENKITPFVDYTDGCGKFVMSEWLNREECPFPYAENFMVHSACANEIQILRFWKQMNPLYFAVSRR